MKNIEVIIIPIFMLSDYYLTILGNIYRRKKYGEHFISETYELNPQWRKDIDKNKWVNYRHLLIVAFITLLFFYISQYGDIQFYDWATGFYLTMYGVIIGRHISNLLLFKFLTTHPDAISGKISMSHQFSLKASQFQTIIFAIPISILTIHSPTAFNIGGITSCLAFFIHHGKWLKQDKVKRKNSQIIEASETA